MRILTTLSAIASAVLLLAACGGDEAKSEGPKVSFGGDSAALPALGEGDVRITSTDGAVMLSVLGDTVHMQLSDSLRNAVKQDVGAKADSQSGLGAMIAKSVGAAVSSAMGFVVRVPVQDMENLRYENGRLHFDTKGGNINIKSSGSGNGDMTNAQFSAADALRFIDAVERRKAARQVSM